MLFARRTSLIFVVTAWVSISWVRAAISYRLWAGAPRRAPAPPAAAAAAPAAAPRAPGAIFWDSSFLWSARGSSKLGSLLSPAAPVTPPGNGDSGPKRRELGKMGVSANDLGKSGSLGMLLGGWITKRMDGKCQWHYLKALSFLNLLDGLPLWTPVRISFSGAILYWLATSLWTACSSSRNSFIRMNGSRPFCVSMCQGFGLAKRSDTLPCDRPKTDSPNSLWLMEYWERMSFT